MKHVIIGTAGHVDHGKTCLVKALTGIDTDRLKEEKRRGITIETGFAYLDMPDGSRAGIVDVPGHEKFIKNMLAGAGGINLAMLAVSADEGVMPQTIEHLDILSILKIKKGVVVITKTDLADSELIDLVKADIKELIKGTFLENAPILPVSAHKKQGLEKLKDTLYHLCREIPEPEMEKSFRLPIDRIFTKKGLGTIVAGTLIEGKIEKNQEVFLYPENISVKIRSMQVHNVATDIIYTGQRTAVNLPERKKEEIRRGDVLASKNSLYPTYLADVRAEALKHTKRIMKNGSRVHVYHGSRELLGKIILMDRDELRAGESCYAQLRLEEETVLRKGDSFVLRFYSPAETIGGGVILDACPKKHRRNEENILKDFEIKEKGTLKEMLELSVRQYWGCFYTLRELCRRSALDYGEAAYAAKKLEETGEIYCIFDEIYIHRLEFDFYRKKAEGFLEEFHKKYPLEEGMGEEEARSRLSLLNPRLSNGVLNLLEKEKIIKKQHKTISAWKFKIAAKEEENAILKSILLDYQKAGYTLPTTALYGKEYGSLKRFQAVFASLINRKQLIRLDEQYCIHREHYEKAQKIFREISKEGPVKTGNFRDCLGCSRKVAIALLEHFDKNGFTGKTEEGRILKAK